MNTAGNILPLISNSAWYGGSDTRLTDDEQWLSINSFIHAVLLSFIFTGGSESTGYIVVP
ncbi:hypothetical protein EU454_26860 [Salmonella enterica subsp. enterica serovar Java]|nr:hypothetical protein [Salmonella enterica subsp. enterica serovar Java]